MPIINDKEIKIEEKEKEEKPIVEVGEIKEVKERIPLPVKMLEEIEGNFTIMSSVPTHAPRTLKESIVLYLSGTTYRLYWFIKDAWKKIYDSAVLPKTFVELVPLSVSKAQSSAATWEDWDLSASVPAGAHAVEVLIYHATDTTAGVRQNGSAATRVIGNPAGWTVFTTLLDANRVIETIHDTTGSTRFWVTGYWT